ncbi:MAG: tetratricopeptide repeat protein [Epsilonproteobacteria bacterium]|nr:tetratricopeptide repeat protein [Campylobacterota bacterium]
MKKVVSFVTVLLLSNLNASNAKIDHFQLGVSHYQSGAYEKALSTFDQILIENPDNQRVRLEYARTLYMMGFYKTAKKEFEVVLSANPPKNVKNNINAYLKKIASMGRKHHFYGAVGIGLTYDDNLGFNTHLETTNYGGLELQNNTDKTKGFYQTLNISFSHLYIGENFNWSNTLHSYNEFQNEEIDNLNYLSFYSTLSKQQEHFKVSLPLNISTAWLDGSFYNHTLALLPTLQIQPSNTTLLTMTTKLQVTQFDEEDKDYQTYGTQLSFVKLFDKLTLSANGTYESDIRENLVRYDVSRNRILLGTNLYYQLLKKSILHFGYLYNSDKYNLIDPALNYHRKDTKHNYNASIKQKLSKKSTATLRYQRLINDSNINTYSYKKNSYSLMYQQSF